MSDYVKVSDENDGEIYIESEDGTIDILYYQKGKNRDAIRRAAEKIAEKKAKELNCDWGCNY